MGKALHHAVIPLRGNERSVLDRAETTDQILSAPSAETYDWLRELHRAFCGEYTRHQPSRCKTAVEAHLEAIEYLLSIFGKVCENDHPSGQNPEIIQSLSAKCFVAGGTFNRPANNPAWNQLPPEKCRKRS